ncbi:MAG: hypothetical protein JW881_21880 [Spirochaetales bacterium]|nr:hypothetical protein [Spirochaetales bacterium]
MSVKSIYKTLLTGVIVFLLGAPAAVFGQEGAFEAEPADPGLVLPTIVLEIEDLSIETIEAVLPEEEELLPPERKVPLPAQEIMEVEEPSPDIALPDDEDASRRLSASSFVSEVLLGAGSVNNILSQISFYKLGESPRFKLLFLHEMLDGFSHIASSGGLVFREGGTGFNYRLDSLDSEFKWITPSLETSIEGSFYEIERGLQNSSDYYSLINRFLKGKGGVSFLLSDWFTLRSDIGIGFSSLSLTGDAAPVMEVGYPPSELLVSPSAGMEITGAASRLGLRVDYRYRTVAEAPSFEFHRLLAGIYGGVELPVNAITLDGSLDYFYNSDLPWLIPFDLAIAGNLHDLLSFRLAGGYRVEQYDLGGLWKEFEYSGLPAGLSDNHGWYADVQIKLNVEDNLILSVGSEFSTNTLLFSHSELPDSQTGLFAFEEDYEVNRLASEAGLRWNIFPWFYCNAKASGVFLWKPSADFFFRGLFEGVAEEENGKYGGRFSLLFENDFEKNLEIPVMDIELFFKITDNVTLIGEGHDLLYPLLPEDRFAIEPYAAPGIRGTIKVHITF